MQTAKAAEDAKAAARAKEAADMKAAEEKWKEEEDKWKKAAEDAAKAAEGALEEAGKANKLRDEIEENAIKEAKERAADFDDKITKEESDLEHMKDMEKLNAKKDK